MNIKRLEILKKHNILSQESYNQALSFLTEVETIFAQNMDSDMAEMFKVHVGKFFQRLETKEVIEADMETLKKELNTVEDKEIISKVYNIFEKLDLIPNQTEILFLSIYIKGLKI